MKVKAAKSSVVVDDLDDLLLEYLATDLHRLHGSGDLYTISSKIRLFKQLKSKEVLSPRLAKIYSELEKNLFGWALKKYQSVTELEASFKGRGIVISLGSKYVKLAVHAIKIFRTLGCNWPVEIFYNGEQDLDSKSIQHLTSMPNVEVRNIQDYFDNDYLKLEGWDLKPFAMLASSFAEVMLVDADAVFVQNPVVLVQDPGYLETGTAFFYDRTMGGFSDHNITHWLQTFLPGPMSTTMLNSRLYNRRTHYEQESGVVVIDKTRRLMGMLAACRLNCPPERDELHKFTHGDKESFYLGCEMAGEPYYFVPSMSGSIGRVRDRKVCGKLAHFDRHDKLLWFNDGIVDNKHASESEPFKYEYYAIEGKHGGWNGLCIEGEAAPVEEEFKLNLHKIVSQFQRDPLEMDNPQTGSAMYNLGIKRS